MYICVYTYKVWQLADPLYHIHAFACSYCYNMTLILSMKGNSPTSAQSHQCWCIISHTDGNTTALMRLQWLCLHDRAPHPARLQYDCLQTWHWEIAPGVSAPGKYLETPAMECIILQWMKCKSSNPAERHGLMTTKKRRHLILDHRS